MRKFLIWLGFWGKATGKLSQALEEMLPEYDAAKEKVKQIRDAEALKAAELEQLEDLKEMEVKK